MNQTSMLLCLALVGFASAQESSSTSAQVQMIARQIILAQEHQEQVIRATGGSGFEQVRQFTGGSRSFHEASITNGGVANVHSHANNKHTIGMGEWTGVLNGVHFGSRHNDYAAVQPHRTSHQYGATEYIPPPETPPAVLAMPTVPEQVEEMRQWFKAWADQDYSVRDYRPYFKAVLSYVEGAWIKGSTALSEPFHSDRHSIDAASWEQLHEKITFLTASGNKDTSENMPYLPSKIYKMGGPNKDIPLTANF